MDYTHEHSIAEVNVNEPFRGWLTRLLAEAFYLEEEEMEIPEDYPTKKQLEIERANFLQQYAKSF